MRRRLAVAGFALGLICWGQAGAFGTVHVDPTGTLSKQNAEHEKITRLALQGQSFGGDTLDQLAGAFLSFGAVGSPDLYRMLTPEAHCDDGDYRALPNYPHKETDALASLKACRTWIFDNLAQAVTDAGRLVNPDLSINRPFPPLTWIGFSCTWFGSGRAKCDVLQSLGRSFHAAQDFYAHSNWSDRLPAGVPPDLHTPPGLGNTVIADFINPRKPFKSEPGLMTGCYVFVGSGCDNRTLHADLNKDTGSIDRKSLVIGDGTTTRGQLMQDRAGPPPPQGDWDLEGNFHRAVHLAAADTTDKWQYFQEQVLATYPGDRGYRILCVVRSDYPKDCRNVTEPK